MNDSREDHKRLARRLEIYGMRERRVRGDGNCQFRALADQLWQQEDRHREVRQATIAQLRRRADLYSPFVPDEEYSSYVQRMSLDTTWGDHLTLQAAADVFGARLCVLTSYKDSFVLELEPQTQVRLKRVLWLSFWAEVHYNSVVPTNGEAVRALLENNKGNY